MLDAFCGHDVVLRVAKVVCGMSFSGTAFLGAAFSGTAVGGGLG
jgi:hypothetical protein